MQHEFVRSVPDSLEPEMLYISIDFGTAVHLCACGCGNEIVTPITPTDWSFTFDGESVSLNPSIGNWSLPCRSHYWIRRGQVIWAAQWTEEEISLGRKMDRITKRKQFSGNSGKAEVTESPQEHSLSWVSRLINWLKP